MSACELCDGPGGELLWSDERCRIVRVGAAEGSAFPGFCRVIWNRHVAEISDLEVIDAAYFFDIVRRTERAIRALVRPVKINLASLGNMVPHLHWHVIPRWQDDSHFPRPIWAEPLRPVVQRQAPELQQFCQALAGEGLARALGDKRISEKLG